MCGFCSDIVFFAALGNLGAEVHINCAGGTIRENKKNQSKRVQIIMN
jgi:hypothetical protein